MVLPADAGVSSRQPGADSSSWIIGGVPGVQTDEIAAASGATVVSRRLGSYLVPRERARHLATRLERADQLVYAEPDVALSRSSYPPDLFSSQQWWLDRIVNPGDVTPPAVTSGSPLLALVEESLDPQHPDLVDANLTGARSLGPASDSHGTAVAAIAGSPGEMKGIRGVWPGARMRLFPSGLTCSTASKAVTEAAKQGAAVINMSYTLPANACFTHFEATQYAVKKGAIPVASAGNSGATGNAAMRPASDPHVLAVGAVDSESVVASFSTRNNAVDITAPGAGVLAPTVTASPDGTVRGWAGLNGTSFSAPMVSAAAAWLRQTRPELDALQVSRLLVNSATDLGSPGRDRQYGAGLLNIEKSLTGPAPLRDSFEPNDDIQWINGTLLSSPGAPLWKPGKGKRTTTEGSLSRAKDPADVYRVKIPARARIVVHVAQYEGDVTLSALRPGAKTISKPGRNLIVRSNRPYPKTEGIVIRNTKKKAQSIWLSIAPASTQMGDSSAYRIKVVRT
ncbi:MAG: S8 family serine peptidase [Solirubrobacterales bacterium]|nr:S8 family serine peptidase [Solirubrobacterales bacterium]